MDHAETQQAVCQALDHLQRGDLPQAEALLHPVLAAQPSHAEALHLMGVVFLKRGITNQAIDLIGRSVQLSPSAPSYNNLGHALRLAGRTDEAIICFDRAIQLQPDFAEAYWAIAGLLAAAGKHEPASRALQRLTQLQPGHPRAHMALGISLAELEYFERAIAAFRRQIELTPGDVEAIGRLSTLQSRLNRHADALATARQALQMAPNKPEAHNNLGWVEERAGNLEAAETHYRRAIELSPQFTMALGNLASICEKTDRLDEAVTLFERASESDPKHIEALCSLAGSYSRVGRYEESVQAAERALAINKHCAAAHGHKSLALLAFGKYEEGFAEYEWRWKCRDFTTPERDFEQPRWRGGDPSGRTILIYCEQGFGDNIQFARYLPLLADLGAKVTVECPVALRRLFETVRGVQRVVPAGLRPPPFDLQGPLLSLPHLLKTTLQNVPAEVPYFGVPQDVAEAWESRLAGRPGKLKVGLLWRGNKKPNPKRSIPLEMLAPLAIPDVRFFSLQVGEQGAEAAHPPGGMDLFDPSPAVKDFMDTAAIINHMDLVITIDSAAAHLAGALGKPTWTMLIHGADWRWLSNRDDSPWYPQMRLFRQGKSEGWTEVINRVAAELGRLVQ